jgi:hypothetical protein
MKVRILTLLKPFGIRCLPWWGVGCFLLLSGWLSGQNDIKRIRIDNNAMVYIPQQDKIFIATPSTDANGNSLCVIDPYFGTIDTCYFIGSEPTVMAASDDGTYLYIGLSGAPKIVRFNLLTQAVDAEIHLGFSALPSALYAEDIKVLPGSSTSFVVSRRNQGFSPRHEGLAVYDGIIRRPNTTPEHTGSNSIAFAANGRLFGGNTETSEFGFRELVIDADGISELAVYTGLINRYFTNIEGHQNRIYVTNGRVINVNAATPSLAGTMVLDSGTEAALEVSLDSNIVYFIVSSTGISYRFERFNKTTFNKISSENLTGVTGKVKSLINWGTNGKLAFNTDKMVVIMRNCTSSLTNPPTFLPSVTGVCFGDLATLTASGGFEHYFWSNGATDQTMTTGQAGEYFFQVADSTGCLGPRSNNILVNIDYPPSTPWISGNSMVSICRGGGTTLNAAGPGANYQWSNGYTGTSITVNQPGQYRVRAVTSGGCAGSYSLPVTVQLTADTIPPRPAVEIEGNTVLCNGESVILSAPDGYHSYLWSNSATTPSITVLNTGTFTVRVVDSAGCTSEASLPVPITVYPVPWQPFIQGNGNLLFSSAWTGNQWFFNGEPISGATDWQFNANRSGFYSVQVTVNGCVSPMSNLYNYFVVSLPELSENDSVLLFPNPAQNEVFIHTMLFENTLSDLIIYNLAGAKIQSLTCDFISGAAQFEISALPSGVYWVEIVGRGGEKRARKKLIKL